MSIFRDVTRLGLAAMLMTACTDRVSSPSILVSGQHSLRTVVDVSGPGGEGCGDPSCAPLSQSQIDELVWLLNNYMDRSTEQCFNVYRDTWNAIASGKVFACCRFSPA